MANGLENYETLWSGNENYKFLFNDADLTSGGFIWARMGGLDLNTNLFDDDTDFSPNFSNESVLIIDTVIGAAISNPDISIQYIDKDGANQTTSVQVLPGMQESTSISIPLPNGIRDITNLSTNVTVSGIISIWSARAPAEEFNPMFGFVTLWSPASPGL